MRMGQCLGLAVALYAGVACDNRSDQPAEVVLDGIGGTQPEGQGSTVTNGGGGTQPAATTGSVPDGHGGASTTGGHVGSSTTGQGGSAGDTGSAGAPGAGGSVGAAATCTNENGYDCLPCDPGYVHVDCGGPYCVCELENDPRKEDYAALLACDLDEPCPESTQEFDIAVTSWENGECLLEALRDRTPGRYRLSARGGDDGYIYDEVTIILDGSDAVILFTVETAGAGDSNRIRQYSPLSCTLRSYAVLDACIAAGTDPSQQGVCADSFAWAESCGLDQNLECPSELP